jgi:hypothetical protein
MDKKIAIEVAETEFDRFVNEMDLDVDTKFMNEDERNGFEKQRRRIVNAIAHGNLVIDNDGHAVYTPRNMELDAPLRFEQFGGQTLSATNGKKRDDRAMQLHSMMAEMTKVGPNTFNKMRGVDTKVCMALTMLLMD